MTREQITEELFEVSGAVEHLRDVMIEANKNDVILLSKRDARKLNKMVVRLTNMWEQMDKTSIS